MKKFVFNLESLLTLRDWEEQNARMALAEANAQVERIGSRIDQLQESITQAFASWNGENGRRFSPMERLGVSSQVTSLEEDTASAREAMKQAETARSKAMRNLMEATTRRKVIANLKEKRMQAHAEAVRKQEFVEIEDVFNARRRIL